MPFLTTQKVYSGQGPREKILVRSDTLEQKLQGKSYGRTHRRLRRLSKLGLRSYNFVCYFIPEPCLAADLLSIDPL